MRSQVRTSVVILVSFLAGILVAFVQHQRVAAGQEPRNQPSGAARTADGKPNLNGIWQAVNTANFDLRAHSARAGLPQLGAVGAAPAGLGVVENNEIPYQPWAAEQQKKNFEKRFTDDPEVKCFLPGVPRATYMPF